MSDLLDLSPSLPDFGKLFYPVNGTGNIYEEGYGQLLPLAAADQAGAEKVAVSPSSVYNAANCQDQDELEAEFKRNLDYDREKAAFLEERLEDTSLEVSAKPIEDYLYKEAFWQYVEEFAAQNSVEQIRSYSPLPDWRARKSVNASEFLEAASELFPVTENLFQETEGYRSADMYLLLQSAESAVARDQGIDAKLGISSEKPFDEFVSENLSFYATRSRQPLDLSGDENIPYSANSDPSKQVMLSDSQERIGQKLEKATEPAADQIEAIAVQLDDRKVLEVLEDA